MTIWNKYITITINQSSLFFSLLYILFLFYCFRVKQHIFVKELSTVIGLQQHNLNALYHDEIPSCLIYHIDTANKNLLQPYSPAAILEITRTLNHFSHDMTKENRPLRKPLCLYLKDFIDNTEDPTDIFVYKRLTFL